MISHEYNKYASSLKVKGQHKNELVQYSSMWVVWAFALLVSPFFPFSFFLPSSFFRCVSVTVNLFQDVVTLNEFVHTLGGSKNLTTVLKMWGCTNLRVMQYTLFMYSKTTFSLVRSKCCLRNTDSVVCTFKLLF